MPISTEKGTFSAVSAILLITSVPISPWMSTEFLSEISRKLSEFKWTKFSFPFIEVLAKVVVDFIASSTVCVRSFSCRYLEIFRFLGVPHFLLIPSKTTRKNV